MDEIFSNIDKEPVERLLARTTVVEDKAKSLTIPSPSEEKLLQFNDEQTYDMNVDDFKIKELIS